MSHEVTVRRRGLKSVGQVCEARVLKKIDQEGFRYDRVIKVKWVEIVGKEYSDQYYPESISKHRNKKTLFVSCKTRGGLADLKYHKQELLYLINGKSAGKIQDIAPCQKKHKQNYMPLYKTFDSNNIK